MNRRSIAVGGGLGLLLLATAAPAGAAFDTVAARWEMNEATGASVMTDASGRGLTGSVGSAVVTGATYGGATGYRWSNTNPIAYPAKPERLVVVPEDDSLDPGAGDFSVEIRYRTTRSFGNIIQKGQAGAPGGYWKFQAPKGVVACLFKGPLGRATATSVSPINDGQWHVVRCDRTATRVTMYVDGVRTRVKNGETGPIDNRKPLSIGGKLNCDQVTITCDYFVGDIDWVRITRS